MKKVLSFIVILCLICTLFVGCGEGSESPTNAPVSQGESVVNKEAAVDENSAVSQQEAVVSKEEQQNNPASSKTSTPSASSKVPVSSAPSKIPSKPVTSQSSVASTPAQNEEGVVPSIHVEYPTFTNEGSLKNWLAGKHPDYFANGQKDMVSVLQNQGSAVYYKPSIPANHSLFTLSRVKVHTPSCSFDYFYNEVGEDAELAVFVAHDAVQGFGYDDMYNLFKSTYENQKNQELDEKAEEVGYMFQHNKVEFYGLYTPADGSCYLAWKQFGFSHFAALQGHFDQIEEMIPLLYLQKVTVKGDTVTQ